MKRLGHVLFYLLWIAGVLAFAALPILLLTGCRASLEQEFHSSPIKPYPVHPSQSR